MLFFYQLSYIISFSVHINYTIYGIQCHLLFGVTHCYKIYQVKMLMLCSVQTINLMFGGNKMRYIVKAYSTMLLQIVSDTKYHK